MFHEYLLNPFLFQACDFDQTCQTFLPGTCEFASTFEYTLFANAERLINDLLLVGVSTYFPMPAVPQQKGVLPAHLFTVNENSAF